MQITIDPTAMNTSVYPSARTTLPPRRVYPSRPCVDTLKPTTVILSGPYAGYDPEGEEFPYWTIRLENRFGNEVGKGYTVNDYDRAGRLAERISLDRGLTLEDNSSKA